MSGTPVTAVVGHGLGGTRVTAVEVDAADDPAAAQTVEIRDDYVLITDGSAQVTGVVAHGNGTHVITVKGVRRRPATEGGGQQ